MGSYLMTIVNKLSVSQAILVRYSILIFIFFVPLFSNGQIKNDEILSDYDIYKWGVAYNSHRTNFIDSANNKIHLTDTLALIAPIIESRTQLDYEKDEENRDYIKLADSLTRTGIVSLLSKVIRLKNVDDQNVADGFRTSIVKALKKFKSEIHSSYQFDSIIKMQGFRYAIIPYIKWVKTIPNFDPKKARNRGFASTNYSRSYTWTRCHAAIFIIDLSDMKIIYYKYEWWWTPTVIISPSSRILNKVLKRCLKPFIREMEKNKKLENIHSGASLGKR